jgi:hypothetical protein
VEHNFTLDHVVRGLVLVSVTVGLQLAAQIMLRKLGKAPWLQRGSPLIRETTAILIAVGVLLVGVLLQVFAWALLYFIWGELGKFANCMYFSFASYTTLGASELSLSPPHRMLGALESAMGMLMFGWSTALLVQIINQAHRDSAVEPMDGGQIR